MDGRMEEFLDMVRGPKKPTFLKGEGLTSGIQRQPFADVSQNRCFKNFAKFIRNTCAGLSFKKLLHLRIPGIIPVKNSYIKRIKKSPFLALRCKGHRRRK